MAYQYIRMEDPKRRDWSFGQRQQQRQQLDPFAFEQSPGQQQQQFDPFPAPAAPADSDPGFQFYNPSLRQPSDPWPWLSDVNSPTYYSSSMGEIPPGDQPRLHYRFGERDAVRF